MLHRVNNAQITTFKHRHLDLLSHSLTIYITHTQKKYGLFRKFSSLFLNQFDDIFSSHFRMVSSFGSNVFYYLHMDPVSGIFIAPIVPNSSSTESIQKSVLNNFYRCCLHMRTVFERSLRNGVCKAVNYLHYSINFLFINSREK